MKTKRSMLLVLISLILVSLVLPACQSKYSLDEEGLLQLQCNASDMEEILDEVGKAEPIETEVKETEPKPTEPKESEPKVTDPGEPVKPTEATTQHTVPVVAAAARTDGVKVTWEKISDEDLSGYKVVYSKTNTNPKYPDDGYYAYITNPETTSCLVKASKVPAGDYYFSVTALYEDGSAVAGNAVRKTMPEYVAPTPDPNAGRPAPQVSVTLGANYVQVSWSKIASDDLVGYKVVASVGNSSPKYSEDGYCAWITNPNTTSYKIYNGSGYSGGDIDTFNGGSYYFFSVTAVYGDEWEKIAGNAVLARMPGDPIPTTEPVPHVAPTVSATAQTDGVLVTWNKINNEDFSGYKVVYSATNPNPAYPGDGYYEYITDRNQTSCLVTGLDTGSYYFSVTALYDDGAKVAGNARQVTYTAPEPTPDGE